MFLTSLAISFKLLLSKSKGLLRCLQCPLIGASDGPKLLEFVNLLLEFSDAGLSLFNSLN